MVALGPSESLHNLCDHYIIHFGLPTTAGLALRFRLRYADFRQDVPLVAQARRSCFCLSKESTCGPWTCTTLQRLKMVNTELCSSHLTAGAMQKGFTPRSRADGRAPRMDESMGSLFLDVASFDLPMKRVRHRLRITPPCGAGCNSSSHGATDVTTSWCLVSRPQRQLFLKPAVEWKWPQAAWKNSLQISRYLNVKILGTL